MKKLLLLSISAMMSLGAMAQVETPTLTQDWEITDGLPAAGNARWGAAFGGKFYLNEKTTGFYSYSAENGTKTTIEGVNVGGTGFNFDGVGNAILSNVFGSSTANRPLTMTNFILWNAETKATSELILSEELLTTLNFTTDRMDLIGRGAGNIFSEEGGAFFLANGKSGGDYKILKLYIANGSVDATKTKLIDCPATSDNGTIVIALTNDPESDDVVYRHRSNYNGKYGQFQYFNGTKWVAYVDANPKPNASAGGDIVKLGDVLFTIEPAGTNYYNGWQIVERVNNMVVASVAENADSSYKNTNIYGTVLSAEKVSDTKAYIYQYHNGMYIRKYTFEIPENYKSILTAIESVEVAAGAVEYYNLQGVKVANPENGLFIKKQGNKVSKVIL